MTGSATVSVTGAGSGKIKSITIPATVRYKGKTYKVTSIGSKAFYKCSKLKSRYAAYRKLFKKAGLGSKVTWKKEQIK